MSYTALYRKFRPDTFSEVKGQEHIVTTLKNQIRADRIGHAYLFCGTRGTGKTTVAKIFAKAVNCEHPVDGNPCNECKTCRAIAAGTSMNVIEIDAASNNGVDNIREIRDEVAYSPAEGKYKVYIIDEVHMLSIGAFNALLKTLEEPPSYVIFILATTESHKIPVTILSRCQRYDFKRITQAEITNRLQDLLAREQVEAEEKAIRYIAKKADGGMRDALSLADQCISFYLGQTLTYEKVLEVLGAVDTEVFSQLLREILRQDVAAIFSQLEDLIIQGRDLNQFVNDFTWYLRNLMLLKASDEMDDSLDVSAENLELLKEEAAMVREDTLMRYIRIFSELANQIKYSSGKRVLLEVALIKLCRPQMQRDELSLAERVRRLERQLEEGAVMAPAGYAPGGQSAGYGPGGSAGAQSAGYGSGGSAGAGQSAGYGPGGSAGAGQSAGYGPGGSAGAQSAGYGSGGSAGAGQSAGYGPGGSAGAGQSAGYGPGGSAGAGPAAGHTGSGTVPAGSGGVPGTGGGDTHFHFQKAAPSDLQQIKTMWGSIIAGTAQRFRLVLASSELKFNLAEGADNQLYVVFADFLGERYLNNPERKAELEALIAEKTGKQADVRFILAADEGIQNTRLKKIEIEEAVKDFVHMDIEIEDEE